MNLDEIFTIIFAFLLMALAIGIFIYIALKLKRRGGSIQTIMFGATDLFYDKDQKRAIEVVVEQKAGKKMEEQSSGEPKEKNDSDSN